MVEFKHKLCLATKELSNRVDNNWLNMKRIAKKKGRQVSAQKYMEELAKEAAKMDSLIADWTRGGHRHIDLKKADGIFRILWENFNSLQVLTDSTILQKMRCLDEHRKRYKTNIIDRCERQTNWYKVPDEQHFDEIVSLGEHTRCKAAHNTHYQTRCQPGGMVIANFGQTSG